MNFLRPFFFGILAAFGALFLELFVGLFIFKLTPLLLISALIEEIFIFIFVYKIYQESKTASKKEMIFSSTLIGAGFSSVELFFILLNLDKQNILFRSAETFLGFSGILLVHIATAFLVRYLMSRSKKIDLLFVSCSLLAAYLVHLAYNFLVMYNILI